MSPKSIPEKSNPAQNPPMLLPVMTHREIGEILGIPRQNVYYIEQKAFKKLRARLAPLFEVQDA